MNKKIIFSDKWQLLVSDLYDCYLLVLKEYMIVSCEYRCIGEKSSYNSSTCVYSII